MEENGSAIGDENTEESSCEGVPTTAAELK